jgi:hypothetical protein
MPRSGFQTVQRTTSVLVLVALILLLTAACDSRSPVSPGADTTTLTSGPPKPPAPASRVYHLSGRVMDDAGRPVAGATVEVDHGRGQGSTNTSICPSIATFCWTTAQTNANGEYSIEFDAARLPGQTALGYVYTVADGYETAIQWVPDGPTRQVMDLRTLRTRPIRPGQTVSVSVEPTSSLCTDLEDNFRWAYRCEVVVIETTQEGQLLVEARDSAGAPAAPDSLFFATSGNYDGGWTQTSPSTLAVKVKPGTFRAFVGVRDGASRQFEIVTTLR